MCAAEDDLRSRVGPQPVLELGPVHEVAGVRKTGAGHPRRFRQHRKMRRDDDARSPRPPQPPTGRRTAAASGPGRPPHRPRQPRRARPDPGRAAESRARRAHSANSSPRRRSWLPFTAASGATSAAASRATMWARSPGFANCTKSPSRTIRSTRASENHSSAASVRRSRCSGSKTLIQLEPAGSSSQWRSLRTPMRTIRAASLDDRFQTGAGPDDAPDAGAGHHARPRHVALLCAAGDRGVPLGHGRPRPARHFEIDRRRCSPQ